MPLPFRSSRRRYLEYRAYLKKRHLDQKTTGVTESFPHEGGTEPRRYGPRSRTFFKLLAEFWKMLAGHHRTLFLVLCALGVSTMLGLVPLYGMKIVVDSVLREKPLPPHVPSWIHLPQEPRALLAAVAVTMIVLAGLSECVGLWSRWQTTRMTKRVQVAVRKTVFDHAVRLPLHRVYELKSGGVASILREDAGGVAELIFSLFYNPSRAIVQLLYIVAILAWTDWRLLLGSLLLLPTVWMTHRTWIGRIRPIFRDIRSSRQRMDSHATESFGGMRVVRSFSRQRAEAGNFTRNGHMMARQEIFAWWWMRGVEFLWGVLIPVASATLLWFGGNRVITDAAKLNAHLIDAKQALTLGDLMMFLSYLAMLLGPIGALAQSATGLQNSLSGLDRILDLLAEPREMPSKPGALVIDRANVVGRITFDNVSFTYKSSTTKPSEEPPKPVLNGVCLDVQPGETIALVGPSGAGKTTLCNLVARFYDATDGRILLDGVDLRDITAESYRRLLGIVEQDTFLFDGTIAANIAYGRRGATTDEIAHAARLANAHEFIEKLPEKYNSIIGERGVKLSGGQRQRLTIARAILADPKILILDEATSNLDTESERLIHGSLQTLMRDRTSFVIAHRLSTIMDADRIVVLENGRIVEVGRHDELMNASGRYRRMVDLQTSPPPSPDPQKTVTPNHHHRDE